MQTSSSPDYPKKGYPNTKLPFEKPLNFHSMVLFQKTWGYHFDLLAPPDAIRTRPMGIRFHRGAFKSHCGILIPSPSKYPIQGKPLYQASSSKNFVQFIHRKPRKKCLRGKASKISQKENTILIVTFNELINR